MRLLVCYGHCELVNLYNPLIIDWPRSAELCLAIGSKITSQHAKGEAADFEVSGVDNYELALWIEENLEFDQLILECYTGGNSGWIHCSYIPEGNRKQTLTYDRTNGYRHGFIVPSAI